MTFLPIVERELRVAARKRVTWHLRVWAVVLASAVTTLFLLFSYIPGAARGAGTGLFVLLLFYAGLLCLLAGVFLTADALSEEKREGTLGLLFLTDLKGYDVVLGKFAGCAINAFYCLFALMPVMAFPLVLGGVTGGEFWRTMLALANLLFFSLCCGIFVSALCRNDRSAASTTFWLLALASCASVAGLVLQASLSNAPGANWLCGAGPIAAIVQSDDGYYVASAGVYWQSLLQSHTLGWAMLGITCWLLPRVWQEKPVKGPAKGQITRKRAGRIADYKTRAVLLDHNPVLWLVGDFGSARLMAWLCAFVPVTAVVLVWVLADVDDFIAVFSLGVYLMWLLVLPMKVVFANQACRFFVEARRSGAIELLLCSPLRSSEIIRGQWLALKRDFLAPVLVVILALLVPGLIAIAGRLYDVWRAVPDARPEMMGELIPMLMGSLVLGYAVFSFVLKLAGLGWLAMWLALTVKKPAHAFGWTVLWGLIMPVFGFCIPAFAIDLFLIFFCWAKLKQEIRPIVFQNLQPVRSSVTSAAP